MGLVLTKNAVSILEQRYLIKKRDGSPAETPENLFRRVAANIALAEAKYLFPREIERLKKKYRRDMPQFFKTDEFVSIVKNNKQIKQAEKEFYELLTSLDFLPNSPTLLNANRRLQQLSACFVIPIKDHIDGIFTTLHDTAMVHKTGAGTGINFSPLRPRGDIIEGSGFTTGPVSFMKVFDAATEQVKLGGALRGANMGILDATHPDIEEFITVKSHDEILTNFNISVGITDAFMKAFKQNVHYEIMNPRTKEVVRKESARFILRRMAEQCWLNGDPGIIFLDRINKDNPTPALGAIESTDSCGEQPLLPYESCNLGSINLSHMVTGKRVNYQKLRKVVHKAVHFLDNVIDMCDYPLKKNRQLVDQNRKIGLGVMGFADLLIKLNVAYDSDEGRKTAEKVMSFIQNEADNASIEFAKKRGVFPAFKESVYNQKSKHFAGSHIELRNATRTTIAPTGTISIIAGCSSGIEPVFALSYVRKTVEGRMLYYFNEDLQKVLKAKGLFTKKIKEEITKHGSLQPIKRIPQKVKDVFKAANDISPEAHIKMQATFQQFVNNGISKTVTLPPYSTPQDIENIYLRAYELGCKGISVYRLGSREGQVMYLSSKRDEQISLAGFMGK